MDNQKGLTLESQCPKEWLVNSLRQYNMTYDYKTDALTLGNCVVEEALALAMLKIEAYYQSAEKIKPYIRDALLIYRHECAQKKVEQLSCKLSYKSHPCDLAAQWVQAVTGCTSHLDIAVLKHFIWQTKRKLKKLQVENHMMPVLFGKSGGGKSMAVQSIISPLQMVSLHTDMTIFGDKFSKRVFTRNFIIFFDELQGSETTNINAMKQIITSPVIEWRTMRSERVMSSPQNSTFIGCSNEPVRDRINDPTSARRFWQFNCSDKLDWETINSIDYIALWQSIDESGPSPIANHIDEIHKVQEAKIRTRDIIEQWLEEGCEIAHFNESSLTTAELYELFKQFCVWQNIKGIPQFQKFARDLKRMVGILGHGAIHKKTNRGTTWNIKAKSDKAVSHDESQQLEFDIKVAG